jgi:membrane-associated phospholipid phosphatase
MLDWTCYTEYGSPSGHSMLSIVLLEFLVRFLSKKSRSVAKYNYIWYIMVILMELTIMFSRVYMGMHSLNQVLFGFMLGCYSMFVYYLYVEQWLYTHSFKYLSEGTSNLTNFMVTSFSFILLCLYQCLVTFLGSFDVE